MAPLLRQGRDAMTGAIRTHGWSPLLLAMLAALVMMLPLRLWLRSLGWRFAASEHAPDGRLRRSGLAVWLLLTGTLLPGYAVVVLMTVLDGIGGIPTPLRGVADGIQAATFVSAFIVALGATMLMPKRSTWRLLDLNDVAALRLRKHVWIAAGLAWFSTVLLTLDKAALTSDASTILLDGLIALAYLGLVLAMMVTLTRLHHRQKAALGPGDPGQVEGGADQERIRQGSWLALARLLGGVAVLLGIIATLLGYLNFAKFVNQQLIGGGIVVLTALLLLKFFDDVATWLFSTDSAVGRTIQVSIGLRQTRLEQAGVLLSGVLQLAVVLVALLALAAPFGSIGSIIDRGIALLNGIPIGKGILKPSQILLAVGVLTAGLALVRLLRGWLEKTYLPRTELDTGAKNSISTVANYLGVIAAILCALTVLGVGLDKLALVLGALSVGIGFGLQAITQNFISGLILLAERPVKIGDWVKLGDLEGDIRRINVRSTEIIAADRSTLVVPNSELITKTLRNLTMGQNQGRVQIMFAVPASTDVVALRQALLDAYAGHEAVLSQPAPLVFIDSILDGNITLNSFAYVSSPRQAYAVRSDLYFCLLEILSTRGITLTAPTDIHIARDIEL